MNRAAHVVFLLLIGLMRVYWISIIILTLYSIDEFIVKWVILIPVAATILGLSPIAFLLTSKARLAVVFLAISALTSIVISLAIYVAASDDVEAKWSNSEALLGETYVYCIAVIPLVHLLPLIRIAVPQLTSANWLTMVYCAFCYSLISALFVFSQGIASIYYIPLAEAALCFAALNAVIVLPTSSYLIWFSLRKNALDDV